MKKVILSLCSVFCVLCCSILFFGCNQNDEITSNFIRFSIKEVSNSYLLDFTIEINNNTSNDLTILTEDFYIEINNEVNNDISFLYENDEIFYAYPTIKSKEKLIFRVRTISDINNKQYNTIILKYKDNKLVNDNVYISNNN